MPKNDVHHLKIGALNCHGLHDKIDCPEVQSLISSCDIFGVSETWFGENDKADVDGFQFYPLNRKKCKGPTKGGIGLFYKNNLKEHIKLQDDISCENFMWCKLSKNYFRFQEDLYVCVVYIPPESSTREKKLNMDHFSHLKDITKSISSESIILMGDFNARTSNLQDVFRGENEEEYMDQVDFFSQIDTHRTNQDNTINKYGRLLSEYCMATRSYIANGRTIGDLKGRLTCHENNGSSTVDYAVLSEGLKNFVRSFTVLDPDTGSDHSAIRLTMTLPLKPNIKKIAMTTLSPRIVWNEETKTHMVHKLTSPNALKQVKELEHKVEADKDNINEVLSHLVKLITPDNTPRKKKPHSNKKKPPKKWYDSSCHEMSKRLKNCAKLLANSPSNPHLRGSFCKTRKEYKKLLKLKKREWRNSMISKLENLERDKPKEYWKIINELREKKHKEVSFNAENFIKFFENLFSKTEQNKSEDEVEKFITETLNKAETLSEPDFTFEELLSAIKLLKNNKAAGPDRIPAEILKACPPHILKLLLKIMNKIKHKSIYPEKWALGITSLLFKEGDDEDPNNYRAITVSDALSKVFAIMLNARIEKWTRENEVICKEQIGFEKKARPSDHLLVIKTLIDTYTNTGQKLFACFVDFQKAFDSVWRTGLFYQLIKYGMNLKIIKILKDMYDKTSICLKLNGKLTHSFKTYRGVRQGCNLSPKLFNILINDIPKIFDDSCKPVKLGSVKLNCLMYADDLVLLSSSEAGLQECLRRLHQYTKKCHLTINMKKTKIIAFNKNGHFPKCLFYLGDQIIETTKSYKYLGSIITNTGNFKQNEQNLKKKGLRASYLISKISLQAKPSTSIKIYEKVVEPILMYNCEVSLAYAPKCWNFERFKSRMWELGAEVNMVTLSFLRQLLGVHKKTPNLAIMGETGKYPLSLKVYIQIFKYWSRLSTSKNELLKASMEANMMLDQQGHQNWLKVIQYLLKVTNITWCPNENEVESRKAVKSFEQNLKKTYHSWWTEKMTSLDNRKLSFFFTYKKIFKFEKYLDAMPRPIRKFTTRLRTSSHNYPVEVLRYNRQKIEREDRKCTICNSNQVGDEIHYLLNCTNQNISKIRKIHIEELRKTIDQFQNFTETCMIQYCLVLNDERIIEGMTKYIKTVAEAYNEELMENPIKQPTTTRYGRLIKKPTKLNL